MKQALPLCRVPLLVASALASGCILSGNQPDDSRSGFHDVTVTWHLKNIDGTPKTSCAAGFTTLYLHLYRQGFVEPPDALVKLPCTPDGSTTQRVATAGNLLDPSTRDSAHAYFDYTPEKDIWLEVTEETDSVFSAVSFLYYVDNLSGDITIDYDIYPDGGMGVAPWSLNSGLTGAPLTSCATAGVDTIEYAVRPYADETAPLVVGGSWPCTQIDPYVYYNPDGNSTLIDDPYTLGSGHTRAYAPDTYFVELRAKRAGVVVGKTDMTDPPHVELQTGNSFHKISPSSIPITDR